jgi:hypothetical protein
VKYSRTDKLMAALLTLVVAVAAVALAAMKSVDVPEPTPAAPPGSAGQP